MALLLQQEAEEAAEAARRHCDVSHVPRSELVAACDARDVATAAAADATAGARDVSRAHARAEAKLAAAQARLIDAQAQLLEHSARADNAEAAHATAVQQLQQASSESAATLQAREREHGEALAHQRVAALQVAAQLQERLAAASTQLRDARAARDRATLGAVSLQRQHELRLQAVRKECVPACGGIWVFFVLACVCG